MTHEAGSIDRRTRSIVCVEEADAGGHGQPGQPAPASSHRGRKVRPGLNPNVGATIELIGGFLGIVVILCLILTWVPRNHQLLATTPAAVDIASIGLGLVGMTLGWGLSRLLRQDGLRSRTIALETGIQNGPLAVLIVLLTFQGEMQQQVLLIPVLYSLFIVLSSSAVTVWFRRITTREALARDRAKVMAMPVPVTGS